MRLDFILEEHVCRAEEISALISMVLCRLEEPNGDSLPVLPALRATGNMAAAHMESLILLAEGGGQEK